MTCYEHLRKDSENKDTKCKRIQSILNAIDQANTSGEIDRNVNKFHDYQDKRKHGRKKIND